MAARVAVLASGNGSNLQALIDGASRRGCYEIVRLIVNRPDAFAAERARRAGIAVTYIDHRQFTDRSAFDAAVERELDAAEVDWVALAGFMRILEPAVVERRRDRIVNIHPSLLPAFRGLHTHRRALAAGVRIAGCTVHIVRPELDAGPIVIQAAVPVHQDDDEASLAARVLAREHEIYPRALALLTSGAARVDGERVLIDDRLAGEAATTPCEGLIWP